MARHTRKPPREPYDPDRVGYRNPPRKHQFGKGQSGNPNGRPPGSKGLRTDLKQVLATMRTIAINGKEITGRTQWLMLEALALRGSHGDLKAIAQLLPLIVQVLGIEDRDSDPNRLSAADDALLDRMMKRWGLGGGREAGGATGAKPAAGDSSNLKQKSRKSVSRKPDKAGD